MHDELYIDLEKIFFKEVGLIWIKKDLFNASHNAHGVFRDWYFR